MGGETSKFFNDVAGAAGDLVDNTVTAANIVGGYIEDGFDQVVNLAEDITKLGGMLLADTISAATAAGKKYFNALKREALRKAQQIKNSAENAANIAKNTMEDAVDDLKDTAISTANKVKDLGSDIGDTIKDTATDFGDDIKDTAKTMGDGIVEIGDQATQELGNVVDDTVAIAESGLNFLISQDWFDLDWANKFLKVLFDQFNRLTNIKFISKSNKKSSKKELKEHDPSDPSSTSQIPGYKNEPELVGEDGKLTFKLVNDDVQSKEIEKFMVIEKRFNRRKTWILILLFILIFLLILNSME